MNGQDFRPSKDLLKERVLKSLKPLKYTYC